MLAGWSRVYYCVAVGKEYGCQEKRGITNGLFELLNHKPRNASQRSSRSNHCNRPSSSSLRLDTPRRDSHCCRTQGPRPLKARRSSGTVSIFEIMASRTDQLFHEIDLVIARNPHLYFPPPDQFESSPEPADSFHQPAMVGKKSGRALLREEGTQRVLSTISDDVLMGNRPREDGQRHGSHKLASSPDDQPEELLYVSVLFGTIHPHISAQRIL